MDARVEDSLLQCLLALCRYHGNASTAEALTSGLPLDGGILTPSLFERAASRVGLVSNLVKKPLEGLDEGLLPAVLLYEDSGACLLMDWVEKDGQVLARVVYPEINESVLEVSAAALGSRYSGTAIVTRSRFQFDQRAPEDGDSKRKHWFWSIVRRNLPLYRDVLIASFFINLFALALPIFIRLVYDRVLPNHAVETLWFLTSGVIIFFIAEAILKGMRAYFIDLAARRVDISASSLIFEHSMATRMEHRPSSVGGQAMRIRGFESVRDFIASSSVTALVDLPFAGLFLGVMAWIAWQMAIPVLIGVSIVLLYGLATQRKLRELAGTAYRAATVRNSTLVEGLAGVETIKATGAEQRMQRKWEETASFSAHVTQQLRLVANSSVNLTGWVEHMVRLSVVVLGAYLIAAGALSFGGLIACVILSGRVMGPFGRVAALLVQYQNSRVALKGLDEMMEEPTERPPGKQFLSRDMFRGDIEFKHVSFSYPDSPISSLNNVSFKIKAGEKVAILGRIGSGKSTLQKLCMGLYQPTYGSILIDGIDLRQLDPGEFRSRVGYVPQDVVLFYGSLRENLTLAHPEVSDQALVDAAETSGLLDFVNRHPQGFDMLVGERGDSLSGGQRKSVALARAIVHQPNILFMDEPTGSMDHSTESLVKRKLTGYVGGRTWLVVTHRNSILEMVDRILVIDNGALVADGPRDQVISALQQGKIGKAQ
ncbi:MAG: type I secretion system permease/ATPase [Pseudomonadota bacterium]